MLSESESWSRVFLLISAAFRKCSSKGLALRSEKGRELASKSLIKVRTGVGVLSLVRSGDGTNNNGEPTEPFVELDRFQVTAKVGFLDDSEDVVEGVVILARLNDIN